VSILGYGYTSRDIRSHATLCKDCARTVIMSEYADVIPPEVMEPLALFELVELLAEAMPEFSDWIGEINTWTVDDEGHGCAASAAPPGSSRPPHPRSRHASRRRPGHALRRGAFAARCPWPDSASNWYRPATNAPGSCTSTRTATTSAA
jgi:hypothetical protein